MSHLLKDLVPSASTAWVVAARSTSGLGRRASPQILKLQHLSARGRMRSSTAKPAYGAWVPDSDLAPSNRADDGGGEEGQEAGMTVFGRYAGEYDASRPDYPPALWNRALDLVRGRRSSSAGDAPRTGGVGVARDDVEAVDVAAGTGRGALALARRGLSVTALDFDAGMLETLRETAEADLRGRPGARPIALRHGPAEETGLPTSAFDLVTALQAFHWFDARGALGEFHRILRPRPGGGRTIRGEREVTDPLLLLAWNDRDLSVDWMREYETLIERYNPKYDRSLKQAEAVVGNDEVLKVMTELFEPAACDDDSFSGDNGGGQLPHPQLIIPNPTPNCTLATVLALTRTFSYVRNALSDSELTDLERDVAALVTDAHGDGHSFDFPWVTKAYLLRPK